MQLAIHRPVSSRINRRHAQYVVGVLGLLIDVCGSKSLLATLLRQTRNEVVSLLAEEEVRPEPKPTRKAV
ncbi:hypothetical protein K2Y11_07880 [bacterium]|jgi:hypothetical protein|nr:hypothetical protein [bacterium]